MKNLSYLLFFTIFIVSCKPKFPLDTEYKTHVTKVYYDTKPEKVEAFKHNGKYINPLLIGQFMHWMSDKFPYFRELDLTASDESNRFYLNSDPVIVQHKTDPTIEYYCFTPANSEDEMNNEHDFTSCEYRYLGTLANGVQVVYYYENSYGSFNPDGLFGFKFTKEKVKGDKGYHIFMKLVNSVGINQNVKFQMDEEHNRVLVIPQSNLADADFSDKTAKPYWVNFN